MKKILGLTFMLMSIASLANVDVAKEGKGMGYKDDIIVKVKMADGKILGIDIVQNNDTPPISNTPFLLLIVPKYFIY